MREGKLYKFHLFEVYENRLYLLAGEYLTPWYRSAVNALVTDLLSAGARGVLLVTYIGNPRFRRILMYNLTNHSGGH